MWEFDVCVILLWHRIEILVMLLKNCRKNSIDLTEFYTHNPIHAILSFSNKQHPTNAVTRYNNTSCLLADQVGGGHTHDEQCPNSQRKLISFFTLLQLYCALFGLREVGVFHCKQPWFLGHSHRPTICHLLCFQGDLAQLKPDFLFGQLKAVLAETHLKSSIRMNLNINNVHTFCYKKCFSNLHVICYHLSLKTDSKWLFLSYL